MLFPLKRSLNTFLLLLLIFLNISGNRAFSVGGGKNKDGIYTTTKNKEISPSTKSDVMQNDGARDTDSTILLNRREMWIQSASFTAASVAAATAIVPSAAYAAKSSSSYETIVPQQRLLEGLATAPVRHIVITGANSGVGLAGAKLLTAAGHRVTLACRTQAKADAAAEKCRAYAASPSDKFFKGRREGGIAVGAECDLASMASIRAFAKSIQQKDAPPINTLVLNAGLAHGQGDATIYRTADGFEETIGVNHLGHFLLANLLAPALANGKNSRLVSTASPVHDPTSGGGDVGAPATLGTLRGMTDNGKSFEMVDGGSYDADKAYKDSKLCNILFMEEAARRFKGKFTVNAFSPGLIADPNGFFRNQNQGFANVFNVITKVAGVAESSEFGGSALAYMAVDPSLADQTGGWYDSAPPGKHQLSKHDPSVEAQKVEEQTSLWNVSTKLVGQ